MKISTVFLLIVFCFPVPSRSALQIIEEKKTSNSPKRIWEFKARAPIMASPATNGEFVYIGSLDSVLYALSVNTGKEKWRYKTMGEIRSTITYNDDAVYLLSGDGLIYAIDHATGLLKWKFKTFGGLLGERKYDFADYYHSSPLLDNDVLYFGSGDGRVYALNAQDGKLIWSFKTNGIIHSSPAIYENKIFIGSFDGHFYALDLASGHLIWKFKTVGHRYFPEGEIQSAPVVSNGKVFIGSRDYNVYALDVNEGFCHWNKQFPLGWAMALSVKDSVLYVGTSDDRLFLAIDENTGKVLWQVDTKFNIFGNAAFDTSMIYFGTLMGKIYAINAESKNPEWIVTTKGYQDNRHQYFKADDSFRDDISSIMRNSDDYISALYNLGAIFSTPLVYEDKLIISSTDGSVYCFEI